MEKFELTILGCGSATPTLKHLPTSQVLNVREKLFMIDCAEGTQLQFRRAGLRFNHLSHIFISHLHGDHCLGLPGLISTLALKGRTADIHIYAPVGAEQLFRPLFEFFCNGITFEIHIHEIDTTKVTQIYVDRSISVTAFPLVHRMPTCGFLFQEVGIRESSRGMGGRRLKVNFTPMNNLQHLRHLHAVMLIAQIPDLLFQMLNY